MLIFSCQAFQQPSSNKRPQCGLNGQGHLFITRRATSTGTQDLDRVQGQDITPVSGRRVGPITCQPYGRRPGYGTATKRAESLVKAGSGPTSMRSKQDNTGPAKRHGKTHGIFTRPAADRNRQIEVPGPPSGRSRRRSAGMAFYDTSATPTQRLCLF